MLSTKPQINTGLPATTATSETVVAEATLIDTLVL